MDTTQPIASKHDSFTMIHAPKKMYMSQKLQHTSGEGVSCLGDRLPEIYLHDKEIQTLWSIPTDELCTYCPMPDPNDDLRMQTTDHSLDTPELQLRTSYDSSRHALLSNSSDIQGDYSGKTGLPTDIGFDNSSYITTSNFSYINSVDDLKNVHAFDLPSSTLSLYQDNVLGTLPFGNQLGHKVYSSATEDFTNSNLSNVRNQGKFNRFSHNATAATQSRFKGEIIDLRDSDCSYATAMPACNDISDSVLDGTIMSVQTTGFDECAVDLRLIKNNTSDENTISEAGVKESDHELSEATSSADCEKKCVLERNDKTFHDKLLLNSKSTCCDVCGHSNAGFHLGAHVCEACKKFFTRSCKQANLIYKCSKGEKCTIAKHTRSQCQFCRFQKCLAVGLCKPDQYALDNAKVSQIPCRICAAPSSGYHFGALTCEGCKVVGLDVSRI